MKRITSRSNQQIKEVYGLRQAKERKKQQQFIAEGLRACTTLINSNIDLIQLYVLDEVLDNIKPLVSNEYITIVNSPVMEKISQATTPSGIVGVFAIPQSPLPSTLTWGLVLAQMNNPGNVGTLIRSCAAMNVSSIVIVEGVDPWHPKVVQASAGFIGNINIFQLTWHELLANKKDLKLCALVITGGKTPKEINFANTLLVIGSEAHGIPSEWINDCDEKLSLPMPGKIESLNAAVAGSIVLYLAYGK